MSGSSSIEWTDATWNPVRGCSRVSAGCDNCYAIREGARHAGVRKIRYKAGYSPNNEMPGPYAGFVKKRGGRMDWTGRVELVPELLDRPLRWKSPQKIFVNSMSDLFHESLRNEEIDRVFAVMSLAPRHTFQVLTKRPERLRSYLADDATRMQAWGYHACKMLHESGRALGDALAEAIRLNPAWPLPNVWLGVSVEDQATADARIPLLLQTPAAVRFVSYEPALGPISIEPYMPNKLWNDVPSWKQPEIDWVIAGGESGPGARPMQPVWARSVRDQCQAAGVPFFFKQWGEWGPREAAIAKHGPDYDPLNSVELAKIGKKAAGALLDGREWREFPEARS